MIEHNLKDLQFLDTLIKNPKSQIITYIYHKLTGTQKYNHFKSPHSHYWINPIP